MGTFAQAKDQTPPNSVCKPPNTTELTPLQGTSSIYLALPLNQQSSNLSPRITFPEIYRKPKRKSILLAQLSETLP
ncbi:MAG TPA: hypothetical protein DCS60_03125 [Opitutae bacterium]|nr:hypothetical protein [Opitutae bacterium]